MLKRLNVQGGRLIKVIRGKRILLLLYIPVLWIVTSLCSENFTLAINVPHNDCFFLHVITRKQSEQSAEESIQSDVVILNTDETLTRISKFTSFIKKFNPLTGREGKNNVILSSTSRECKAKPDSFNASALSEEPHKIEKSYEILRLKPQYDDINNCNGLFTSHHSLFIFHIIH